MYKISKSELLELLKQAHSQAINLCDCEFNIEDKTDNVSIEEIEKLEALIEKWILKEN